MQKVTQLTGRDVLDIGNALIKKMKQDIPNEDDMFAGPLFGFSGEEGKYKIFEMAYAQGIVDLIKKLRE